MTYMYQSRLRRGTPGRRGRGVGGDGGASSFPLATLPEGEADDDRDGSSSSSDGGDPESATGPLHLRDDVSDVSSDDEPRRGRTGRNGRRRGRAGPSHDDVMRQLGEGGDGGAGVISNLDNLAQLTDEGSLPKPDPSPRVNRPGRFFSRDVLSRLSGSKPDDESSTFLRVYHAGLSCGHRLFLYLRQAGLLFYVNARARLGKAGRDGILPGWTSRVDVSRLVLVGLAAAACALMTRGAADVSARAEIAAARGGGGASRGHGTAATTSSAAGVLPDRGHGARVQVPIPAEYARYVELGDFARVVSAVREHRKRASAAGEEEDGKSPEEGRRRRLGGADEVDEDVLRYRLVAARENRADADEEDEASAAIDLSWQKAMEDAPRIGPQYDDGGTTARPSNTPVFWHVPRNGGRTLSKVLSSCHSLVLATSSFSSPALFRRGDDPALASAFRDPDLRVVRAGGTALVNVDLDSVGGVERARGGGLAEAGLADVVFVPDARLGSLLFGGGGPPTAGRRQGVLFTMMRHPVHRAVSLYRHARSDTGSVHHDPRLGVYGLNDWVNSPGYVNDYMVRVLVGKVGHGSAAGAAAATGRQRQAMLTHDDLDAAKEVLRRKFVVGLLDEKAESLRRFERFFGWDAAGAASVHLLEDERAAEAMRAARFRRAVDGECRERTLHWDWEGRGPGGQQRTVEEGSLEWGLVEGRNRMDVELYEYALQLFDEQYVQLGFDE